MTDRVHPRDSPSSVTHLNNEYFNEQELNTPRPSPPSSEQSIPPPPAAGTYVIQLPKDQVYRIPPPENARQYERLTRRHNRGRRSPCCCCLCSILAILALLVLFTAVTAGILYLVYKPKAPDYTINKISINGLNLTSTSPLSPRIDVTVRANNPNDKIGIYYVNGSDVNVFYEDVELCDGVLPVFYQPTNNVTVFNTVLKGSGIKLTNAVSKSLVTAQNKKVVPLKVHIRAPVKIKVGSVKTWTITVKVDCDVKVDKLTASSNIFDARLFCDCHRDLLHSFSILLLLIGMPASWTPPMEDVNVIPNLQNLLAIRKCLWVIEKYV
ncbi:hypothetical protein ACFE04_011857 [Oxalis oulophora]